MPASMSHPVASVVIATYDRSATIRRAVDSVLQQSCPSFELIVVDDGSTDRSANILAEYQSDPRLRVLRQSNRGRCAARNRGALAATGRVLTFLDSDDEVAIDWLESLVEAFDDPDVAVVCCGARIVVQRPGVCSPQDSLRLPRDLGPTYGHLKGLFLTGTYAIRRRVFVELGGYEESMAFSENTDLLHRLLPQLAGPHMRVKTIARPLMTFWNTRPAANEANASARLHAALLILKRHGHRYFRTSRRSYSNYCGIAAVNAARLGNRRLAWRWALRGALACPWHIKGVARLPTLAFGLLGRLEAGDRD